MPDATHGVPVWRFSGCPKDSFVQYEPNVRWDNGVPGTWYPADEAAALEGVMEAARVYASSVSTPALWRALDRLDKLRRP